MVCHPIETRISTASSATASCCCCFCRERNLQRVQNLPLARNRAGTWNRAGVSCRVPGAVGLRGDDGLGADWMAVGVANQIVDAGHTVLLIERHLDVIKTADHVIDLGPDGGHAGGEVVATGKPEDIAACKASHTEKISEGAPAGLAFIRVRMAYHARTIDAPVMKAPRRRSIRRSRERLDRAELRGAPRESPAQGVEDRPRRY